MKKKIAIIGGGIAGLTAGYLLHEKYDITLYEKTERLGGNAYTYTFKNGQKVDIAAAAFGDKVTYPKFSKLISKLNIPTKRTIGSYMSFYGLENRNGLYFTPFSLKGLISQKFDMFKPKHVLSYIHMLLGTKTGTFDYKKGVLEGKSFEEFIANNKYLSSSETAKLVLICGLCLLSSMSGKEVLNAPAHFFIEKLLWLKFFSPRTLYSVLAPINRTESYVNALSYGFKNNILFNSNIQTVIRNSKNITLVMKDGKRDTYDSVIFACPADSALKLLEEATEKEKRLLGPWKFRNGKIVVHNDFSSFPPKELIQGFTFLYTKKNGVLETSVNGALWHLPGVPNDFYYLSSQHPNFKIKDDLKEFETSFRTPIYDFNSYATLKHLSTLNGDKNTYYCGSYIGYGLHEHAISSAIDVAKDLGVTF